MKKILLILSVFVLGFIALPLSACWAEVPTSTLISRSSLIIDATVERFDKQYYDGASTASKIILDSQPYKVRFYINEILKDDNGVLNKDQKEWDFTVKHSAGGAVVTSVDMYFTLADGEQAVFLIYGEKNDLRFLNSLTYKLPRPAYDVAVSGFDLYEMLLFVQEQLQNNEL